MDYNTIIRFFAVISLVIGAVSCFAGYKTLKSISGVWGFFIGAMIGVLIGVGINSTGLGTAFVVVLGLGLAFLFFRVDEAGAFIFTLFWTTIALTIIFGDVVIAVLIAVLAGAISMFFEKMTVMISSSVSGAGVILMSAYIMMSVVPEENAVVTAILWVPIALAGMACQYITAGNMKQSAARFQPSSGYPDAPATFSERKYPGMQRAYRNFCINCGCRLSAKGSSCSRCGFRIEE